MNLKSSSIYKVGGSLPAKSLSYVKRQADDDLYRYLTEEGEYCYVLNSRQTGKSSLQVRTMRRLLKEGYACVEVDLTEIGSQDVTSQQWYGGFIRLLINAFDLSHAINLNQWWAQHEHLTPVQCFAEFIDGILLKEVKKRIIIFIDEIDNFLELEFKDNFFELIRRLYNKHASNPEYNRLSFVFLGVANPSDLIGNASTTPFNIGKAIELRGFELSQVKPLENGLENVADNPRKVLEEIISWTSGQPFLTQKLCQLILTDLSSNPISSGSEEMWVNHIVHTKIIENWEAQDHPEHLKTIRDRLLSDSRHSGRLLGVYKDICKQGGILAKDDNDQRNLCLSGLVTKRDGSLKVYNQIYALVFNLAWVERELEELHPYSEELAKWIQSNRQNNSYLLKGDALQSSLDWKKGKCLSYEYEEFLDASQELEKQDIKIERLQVEISLKEEKNKLEEAKKTNARISQKSRNFIFLSVLALMIASVFGVAFYKLEAKRLTRTAQEHFKKGDLLEAREILDKSIIRPQSAHSYLLRGNIFERSGELGQAMNAYSKSLRKGEVRAYIYLARLYVLHGDILNKDSQDAISLLDELSSKISELHKFSNSDQLSLDEIKYFITAYTGWALYIQKDVEEAESAFEAAININNILRSIEKRPDAYCLLAESLENRKYSDPEKIKEFWYRCASYIKGHGQSVPSHEAIWKSTAMEKLEQ